MMRTATIIFFILVSLPSKANRNILDFHQKTLSRYKLSKETTSICFLDPKGAYFSINDQQRMMPASITKIYTTFVALKLLGKDHRFTTQVYLEGKNLYLKGDLDGIFSTEHLFLIMNELNLKGVSQLESIYFDGKFFVDSLITESQIKATLFKAFNVQSWDDNLRTRFDLFKSLAPSYGINALKNLKFKVNQINLSEVMSPNPPFLSLNSSPLLSHLKEMNIYSNNKYAYALFTSINDPILYNEVIWSSLNSDEQSVQIFEGSGGERNYTNCKVTLSLFKKLDELMNDSGGKLESVMNVAPLDGGTLRNRFKEEEFQKVVIAKTGTLENGVSTLGGALETAQGRAYFTLLNKGDPARLTQTKEFEDEIVKFMIREFGGKGNFTYSGWKYYPLEN